MRNLTLEDQLVLGVVTEVGVNMYPCPVREWWQSLDGEHSGPQGHNCVLAGGEGGQVSGTSTLHTENCREVTWQDCHLEEREVTQETAIYVCTPDTVAMGYEQPLHNEARIVRKF